jgi:hypothetical protein
MSLLKTLYQPILLYLLPLPPNLTDFTQIKLITHDNWNMIHNNDTHVEYISYRAGVGQVGLFFIDESYQKSWIRKTNLITNNRRYKKIQYYPKFGLLLVA